MEILRIGTKNQAECSKCGTLIRFNSSDVHLEYHEINVGPYEIDCIPEPEDHYRPYVVCPCCNGKIIVRISRAEKRDKINRDLHEI